MKILVATKHGQGLRKSDFCWCEEGEPVDFAFLCDKDVELAKAGSFDTGCGCCRSMTGFHKGQATTTFTVVDVDLKSGQYIGMYLDSVSRAGWIKDEGNPSAFMLRAMELMDMAKAFQPGQILEKRGENICIRVRAVNKR